MSEPFYEFHKSQGWVCSFIPQVMEATTYDGKKVRIYNRLPKAGERYRCLKRSAYPSYVATDNSANLDKFKTLIESTYLSDWRLRQLAAANKPDEYTYVVIELIDG